MTYYLITSYGGYAKGVEVYKLQAKTDAEAYEKAEEYGGHPFAITTLLNKKDAVQLVKHLGNLIQA